MTILTMTLSPPARGAWIEILIVIGDCSRYWVAPREGGVD